MLVRLKRAIWRLVAFAFSFLAMPVAASDMVVRVDLPSVASALPALTVRLADGGERTLTVGELETLGTWRIRTSSPWEDGEMVLEGPLLRDVLAHVGLQRAPRILVRAADAYAPEIPQADWRDYPVILATRSDGRLLGRRNKGPTRIVYPLLQHPELGSPDHRSRWVWLIASIEPVL